MTSTIEQYNLALLQDDAQIGNLLSSELNRLLPEAESKIWHSHPVWFLDGNPIAGYSKQKKGIRLMFWSGADFDEPLLTPGTGKFKDASFFMNDPDDLDLTVLARWISKAREIQWDYKNLVKRKGKLERMATTI
ncbi:MAG: DUF1801 domain-containing protein [Pedobacter sp.]|nr:MAG: DUF1801 domain-containing protein [Pedobacter sp.]